MDGQRIVGLMVDPRCQRCHALGRRRYRLTGPGGLVLLCGRCALLHGPLVLNGVRVAAVVGTILTAVNQGDVLLHGEFSSIVLGKMVLTYVVPYVVATYGALAATRVHGPEPVEDNERSWA